MSWKDNNTVKVMSNTDGLHPFQKVTRWSKTEKRQVKVDQPHCIATYNKSMGGVDRMDWFVNKYPYKDQREKMVRSYFHLLS